MNCAHLFNGIGGFALAAHWMGWNNVMHCEIDPFCNKVMNHHFPNSYQYEDIRTTDFSIWRGSIDLITGGFPCQPYSTAGKRKGKEDDRHLWPEMLRAIREIQPGWIVGENVRGLTNWNGGLVFDEVQADLEAEGYEVLPFLLPAAGVNAPHRRDRLWFIAYSDSSGHGSDQGIIETGCQESESQNKEQREEWNQVQRQRDRSDAGRVVTKGVIANTNSKQRSEGRLHTSQSEQAERHSSSCDSWSNRNTWEDFPTQSPVCNRDDGFPGELVDITFSKWRNESVKALGNAIVPQVAYELFKAIEAMSNTQDNWQPIEPPKTVSYEE